MVIFFTIPAIMIISTALFMQQSQFGKLPEGELLKRIRNSVNFREVKFQNHSFTPDLAEDVSYFSVLKQAIFERSKRSKPETAIPSAKTNLKNLDSNENILVWFGHSSYFMQIDGKKILVDPVFSGSASPLPYSVRSFKGTDIYTPDDFPGIDYLFITHDHWDHLDYKTVINLRTKVKKIITGIGNSAHFESWGFDMSKVIDKDWGEKIELDSGFTATVTAARHFSGRGFKRNRSIWASFVLASPTKKIYIGGDSGYDSHFSKIGSEHGPFDLAILECGQYNYSWKYIHMMPEETAMAAKELNAKVLFPVHWGKFSLALHSWDEPITRVVAEAEKIDQQIIHPIIGEKVNLELYSEQVEWWKDIK